MAVPSLEKLHKGLIVSLVASKRSPMNDPYVIAAMAEASLINGAIGVLVEGPEQVGAVRRRCPHAFIIGLWKRIYPDSVISLTPGWKEVKTIWAAGADCIVLDATARARPGGQMLQDLVSRAREELGAFLIAGIDDLPNGLRAIDLGFTWISTTLYGYTEQTSAKTPPCFHLLESLRENAPSDIRFFCEGGITSPKVVLQAFSHGADNVVIGDSIIGFEQLVKTCCGDVASQKSH